MLRGKEWRQFISIKLLLVSIILAGAAINASAAWGDLDTSFGSGGTYQEASTNYIPADVVVQPDGKILVTGCSLASNGKKRFMLRRYLSSGALDTAFGNNGSAVINVLININYDYCGSEIKMASYSKIAVLGYGGGNNVVWLVNSSGYGESSFGYNGYKSLSNYPVSSYPSGQLGILSGRTIIGFHNKSNNRIFLIRLNVDGTQDTNFGTNGESYTGIYGASNGFAASYRFITEPDTGKITIGGVSNNGSSSAEIKLERKFSSGAKDFWFNPAAISLDYPIVSFTGIYKMSSGKYVYSHYNADGVSFHSKLVRTDVNGFPEEILGGQYIKLAGIQPDEKIVVDGAYGIGRFDESLNGAGSFSHYPNISAINYRQYAFQADNKMIVVGLLDDKLTIRRLLAN